MKYCSKCGNANTDEAIFCSSCGSTIDQAPAAPQPAPAPEPPTYTAPQPVTYTVPQQPIYTAPTYDNAYTSPAAPAAEAKNSSTLWLILNIVLTVLCCPFSFIFSVIGIIFAAMGMSSFNKGDFEDMKKKSKISMIMFIVGAAIGLILMIITIVVIITSGALANYSSYN
jgi:hypothetical protein